MLNQNRLSLCHNLDRIHPSPIHLITCRIIMNSGHSGQIKIINSGEMPHKQAVLISKPQSINKQDLPLTILNLMANLSAMITIVLFVMMLFAWAQMLSWTVFGSCPINGMWNSPTAYLISLLLRAWIHTTLNILWMVNHLALVVRPV